MLCSPSDARTKCRRGCQEHHKLCARTNVGEGARSTNHHRESMLPIGAYYKPGSPYSDYGSDGTLTPAAMKERQRTCCGGGGFSRPMYRD